MSEVSKMLLSLNDELRLIISNGSSDEYQFALCP